MATYSFDVLLKIQVHNDPVESEYTNQFEQTKQLKLLRLLWVQENLHTNQQSTFANHETI